LIYVKYLIYYTHIIEIDNRLNNGDIEMATDKTEKDTSEDLAENRKQARDKELYDAIGDLYAIKTECLRWSLYI